MSRTPRQSGGQSRSRWKTGLEVAAAVCTVAAGIVALLTVPSLLGHSTSPSPSPSAAVRSPRTGPATPGGTSPSSAPASPTPEGTSSLEVTLPRYAAVDVDRPGQTAVPDQSGLIGDLDLFHDVVSTLSVMRAPDKVYPYPSNEGQEEAYATCHEYTRPGSSASRGEFTSVVLGHAFCFKTSDGHVAWASITSVQEVDKTATLRVLVWPN